MKKYLHIIVAIILAVIAGLLVWTFINANAPTQKVTVATTSIPTGATITNDKVQTKLVAKNSLPPNTAANQEQIIGKIASMPILTGDIIRAEHISEGKGSLLSILATEAPGRVAVDLPSGSAIGLKGLERGDKVNIYGDLLFVQDGQAASKTDKIADNAILLYIPRGEKDDSLIVAVTPEEEKIVAESFAGNKDITVFLQQVSEEGVAEQEQPTHSQGPVDEGDNLQPDTALEQEQPAQAEVH